MYFELSAKVADAIELLIQAQRAGEKTYCDDPTPPVLLENLLPGKDEGLDEET